MFRYPRHQNQPEFFIEGGVRGVPIPQNRTEIRVNTSQNNIRKPETTLKLPENFQISQTAWFCKTAIPQLKIKVTAKPHQKSSITANPYTPLFIRHQHEATIKIVYFSGFLACCFRKRSMLTWQTFTLKWK